MANATLQAGHHPYVTPSPPRSFNPTAWLPARIVKKILNLEYVDMAEITKDDGQDPIPGRPQTACPPIQDISQWAERYALMAGTFPTTHQLPPNHANTIPPASVEAKLNPRT